MYRDRLRRFYAHYNPLCLGSVDAILATYTGREDDLMRVLVDKYGPEPQGEPFLDQVDNSTHAGSYGEGAGSTTAPHAVVSVPDKRSSTLGAASTKVSKLELLATEGAAGSTWVWTNMREARYPSRVLVLWCTGWVVVAVTLVGRPQSGSDNDSLPSTLCTMTGWCRL